MSREKDSKKKKNDGAIKDHENTSRLFTDVDAKSFEVSDYAMGRGAPRNNGLIQDYLIPTGVVGVDESVIIPASSSSSRHQHDSRLHTTIQPSETHDRNHVYLPPINNHQQQQYYPYEYSYIQPDYYHSEYLYHPHHHHHHKHTETYDPRWWYMPLNSVHGPKSHRPSDYHYVPPKWYELPGRQ